VASVALAAVAAVLLAAPIVAPVLGARRHDKRAERENGGERERCRKFRR
jgi:hypothetical protein